MKKARLTTSAALFFLSLLCPGQSSAQNQPPVADAGLPRYAAADPVQLDGTGSYDPDNSGLLSYQWQQIAGPSVAIVDAGTATPTISGFIQTDEIQECEFELVVSDGELTSLPDTVKVLIVPSYPLNRLPELRNEFFDPDKPTIILFRGGDGVYGAPEGNPYRLATDPLWLNSANIISFRAGYEPDSIAALRRTYYRCGDMIIVYLSSVAPNYKQAIQTIGHSTGGLPAMDVGLHLNLTYKDRRYAINRVTLLDVGNLYWRDPGSEDTTINQFLASSVDGEQCWIDDYWWGELHVFRNVLNVQYPVIGHAEVRYWYSASLSSDNVNQFNNGVVAGAYWSVIGPGKNLQLASTGDYTYVFKWPGGLLQEEPIELYDESSYPGRLPEPVTLIEPIRVEDPNGVLLSCEESENAVGYQLLLGSDPYRVMDYKVVCDTAAPPNEVITSLPYEQTWWTVRVRDQYGSTIYADPLCIDARVLSELVKNLTTDRGYLQIQRAIDDAESGDVLVVKQGTYLENIDFQGKNLTVRSTNADDPAIVAATVINGGGQGPAVTFSGGEDANCVLAGFTITGGNTGIYCSGVSPTITNCVISGNSASLMGGGMYNNNSSPAVMNCVFSGNSAPVGGAMYNNSSSPTITNCTFGDNAASSVGAGMFSISGNVAVTNCIFWNNRPDQVFGVATVSYSDVQGGFSGQGNIDADPLFIDLANGDYRLQSQAGRWEPVSQTWIKDDMTSPCIDAGNPDSDWTGELWAHGKRVNMGACGGTAQASMSLSSAGSAADCNNDDAVDIKDLRMLMDAWLAEEVLLAEDINRDGSVNFADFEEFGRNWLGQQ